MIIPYLSFQGNCEEAMNLYCNVLDGKVKYVSRYTEQTGGASLAGKVMHMEASFGACVISASDQEKPVENGDAIRLMVHCKSAAEANRMLDALGAEGKVLQRLTPHPPPDDNGGSGLVRDAYGYTWIITAPIDRA